MMRQLLCTTIVTLTVAGFSVSAGPRFSVGPTVLLGSGRMNSSAIEESLDRRAAMEQEIKEPDVTAWLGYSLAGGAVFAWHLSDRWAAEIGLTYHYLANTIEQELVEDDAHEVLSYRERIESSAHFTTTMVSRGRGPSTGVLCRTSASD